MSMKRMQGLMLGLTSGALFGLLFAQDKGKELRTKLKKEWKGGGSGFKTVAANMKGMGHDFMNTMDELTDSPQIKSALNKGKETFYEVTGLTAEDIDNLAKKAKKQADRLHVMATKLKKSDLQKKVQKSMNKTMKNVKAGVKKVRKEIEKRME